MPDSLDRLTPLAIARGDAPRFPAVALRYDPGRMPVICRHFGICGGCQTQDVPYPEQLSRKRRALQTLLDAVTGAGAPVVAPVVGMPAGPDGMPREFRHKAAFVFGSAGTRGGALQMGHYQARTRRVVPVVECPVHGRRANRLAFALRDHLARAGVPAAGPALDGVLRQLVVRTTADEREALMLLVVTRNDPVLRKPIRAFLASADKPDGLFITVHARDDPFMVGERPIRIDGAAHVREHVTGTTMLLSPTAFFQTNPIAARVLVAEVVGTVGPVASPGERRRVLDLYAGSGLFALPLAGRGHSVVAVEENVQAVRDGIANATLNGIPRSRVTFIAQRTESYVRQLAQKPDTVVLDPPRQGCPPAVIDHVFGRLQPIQVIYVSCNPQAFAGELPAMLQARYRLQRVLPVDMFPHTGHVELVATLALRGVA
jgi:23S rRNA (uracil1939-C5)-methyltransferase